MVMNVALLADFQARTYIIMSAKSAKRKVMRDGSEVDQWVERVVY